MYEKEMLIMFSDMLKNASNNFQRVMLLFSMSIEAMPWIAKEHVRAIIRVVAQAPRFFILSFLVSCVLMAPFFLIVGHNLYELRISNEALSPLFQTVGHFWFVYTLILPLLALLVTVVASVHYIKPQVLQSDSLFIAGRSIMNLPMGATMLLAVVELHALL
jgi:hypothetical protein